MNMPDNTIRRGLSRSQIKYIATFAMVLNHIAAVFLNTGTWQFSLLSGIGYMTAPVMCRLLPDSFAHTRSRTAFGLRLLLFAFLSQIPFTLAFYSFLGGRFELNMLFTLYLCFLLLSIQEYVRFVPLRYPLVFLILFASLWCDWGLLAPAYVLIFNEVRLGNISEGTGWIFTLLIAYLSDILNLVTGIALNGNAGPARFLNLLLVMTGPAVAAFLFLRCYTGKEKEKGSAFSKWFFYIFYPAHLLVLVLIREMIVSR